MRLITHAKSARGYALGLLAAFLWLEASASGAGKDGAVVYEQSCAVCHGANGDGQGPGAKRLAIAPRDFRKGVYEFRSTASGSLPTDTDLMRSIVCGIPGTGMVPQTHLSESDLEAVVAQVKAFSSRFAGNTPARPLPLPSPIPLDHASLDRGRKVYEEMGCVQCHGEKADGAGPSASKLSMKPTNFLQKPYKSGPTPRDLVRSILTGLDGTPMPSYHLLIADADVWALAYYLDSLGKPVDSNEAAVGWQIEGRTVARASSPLCANADP